MKKQRRTSNENRTETENEMNGNDYVERAMGLCGAMDSHNRNTFAKSFGELSADQSEEVLAAFTQKLSEGTVGAPAAYLTGMLKRKIGEVHECTPPNSVSEGVVLDDVVDNSDSEDSDSKDFESDDLAAEEIERLNKKLHRLMFTEGPRYYKNLSPNAHHFGLISHLYDCSRRCHEKPSCRLAFILGGIEALVFGRMISYPEMKIHRTAEEEAMVTEEQRAAHGGFYLLQMMGTYKCPEGKTLEYWNHRFASALDDDMTKDPDYLKEFRLY